jgi:uncharacterized membrane protein
VRALLRTPNWEDFVHLAFTEIRFYGAANIQIARRVRAMIMNLANTLPAKRHLALRQELDLLDRRLEKCYILPEDLELARARHARLGWINGRKCVSITWVNCDRAPNDAKIA